MVTSLEALSPQRPSGNGVSRPNRRAVTEWTIRELYRAIFSGELGAGDVLGEVEWTRRLGVSRSPVREALRTLEADGIVRASPLNGQRQIAEFGVDDIRELYTIRAALEQLAAEVAVDAMTDRDLTELAQIAAQMEHTDSSRPEGRRAQFDADFRFHERITRGAGMPHLLRTLSGLWLQSRVLLEQLDAARIYPQETEVHAVRDDHRAILSAIVSRDGFAAREAVGRHLHTRRDVLAAAVDRRGGLR